MRQLFIVFTCLCLLFAPPSVAATYVAATFDETLKAAEQGRANAQYNLGLRYDKGRGVTRNNAEAMKWYRKAAEQGYASAQFNLGVMYAQGQGVTRSYETAYIWIARAAAQGHEKAQKALGLVEKKLTPEQVNRAQKVASNWQPTINGGNKK